jgi:hypothetical protein
MIPAGSRSFVFYSYLTYLNHKRKQNISPHNSRAVYCFKVKIGIILKSVHNTYTYRLVFLLTNKRIQCWLRSRLFLKHFYGKILILTHC